MTRRTIVVMIAVVLCAAMAAEAGIRADLSGDAVVDFTTTMDMPFMAVGNAGNAGELSGSGAGGYGPDAICGAVGYNFNIGKFEVTAGQYTEFLSAVAATDTYGLYHTGMGTSSGQWGCGIERHGTSGNYSYTVTSDRTDRPVNYVSWADAARFANWLTNGMPTGAQDLTTTEDGSYILDGATNDSELLTIVREADARYVIPAENEWYKAAYHVNDGVTGNYFDYPTSGNAVPSNDLVDPDAGNNANFCQGDVTLGDPLWRTEVGEFEASGSPYGTFDQGGNILEWNETIISSRRGLRGGSCTDYFGPNGDRLHAASRRSSDPSYQDSLTGFRIAEVPEPATMSLLTLGGLLVLRKRHPA